LRDGCEGRRRHDDVAGVATARSGRSGRRADRETAVRLLGPVSFCAVRDAADRAHRRAAARRYRHRMSAMDDRTPEPGVVLTEEQKRRRRARSIALALALGALVALFYLVTIVNIVPGLVI